MPHARLGLEPTDSRQRPISISRISIFRVSFRSPIVHRREFQHHAHHFPRFSARARAREFLPIEEKEREEGWEAEREREIEGLIKTKS